MKHFYIYLSFLGTTTSLLAGDLDTIGVTLLRQVDPFLKGYGVIVAQPEAGTPTTNDWEVNPGAVGQDQGLFTWSSALGTATNYPNLVGAESGHANAVGDLFFGSVNGVAPAVGHVHNYEANYFVNTFVNPVTPISIPAKIVNQSFVGGVNNTALDQKYDNYARTFNTLFISGAGNGGTVQSPASCYNGIGVAAYGGSTSVGPTVDGRSKPDITAPGSFTSVSTPLVSGSAAVLLQAANEGDGGSISAASDIRTLKALLLNGAVKPVDWTSTPSQPLDTRYGAGIVNVFNSYMQLVGGKKTVGEFTSETAGGAHPPGSGNTLVNGLSGWDLSAITNTPMTQDRIHHYYFSLTNLPSGSYTMTATLTWFRGGSGVNDLDLFLYDRGTGTRVALSTSIVDNVEHIFLPALAPGQYDLQVLKNGASGKRVTTSDTYALAFEFFATPLAIARAGSNITISWPIAPDGFILESANHLNPPLNWTSVGVTPLVTNNLKVVTLSASSAQQFFRLRRP